MKIQIIKIGNSRGIRLPKSVLDNCGFKNEADLQVKNKKIIVSPLKKARHGWEKQFEKESRKNPKRDRILEDFEKMDNEWDETEWKW
jgi:antitoxin MazE